MLNLHVAIIIVGTKKESMMEFNLSHTHQML